jgi:hypothetical protein
MPLVTAETGLVHGMAINLRRSFGGACESFA